LTDHSALVPGIANDHSFAEIYEYQLEAFGQPGDLVVAISASGNSSNLVRAIEYANSDGFGTAVVLCFDGGKIKELVDVVVYVATQPTGRLGRPEGIAAKLSVLVSL
jgi:D-sedoheptulose 7-phosphate isomerase